MDEDRGRPAGFLVGVGTLVKLTIVFLFVVYNVVLNGASDMVNTSSRLTSW